MENPLAKHRGRELKDITGQKFGDWTAISRIPGVTGLSKPSKWLCRCVCGTEKVVVLGSLTCGKSTQCGCKRFDFSLANLSPMWRGHGEIPGQKYHAIEVNAKKRGLDFTVSIEYLWELFLLQDRKCALSGLPIAFPRRSRESGTASLDRIDSNIGYVSGNVQWTHKAVNFMKSCMSETELFDLCKRIVVNSCDGNLEHELSDDAYNSVWVARENAMARKGKLNSPHVEDAIPPDDDAILVHDVAV